MHITPKKSSANRRDSQIGQNVKKDGAAVILGSKNVLDLQDVPIGKGVLDLNRSQSGKKTNLGQQDDEDGDSHSSES